jgi:hypothetical protein
MSTKMKALLVGSILVVASGTAAAGSSVHFGISLGVPAYPAPVYAPAPVYVPAPPVAYYPAPVYYTTPVYYAPRPVYGPGVVVRYSNWGHRHFHHR